MYAIVSVLFLVGLVACGPSQRVVGGSNAVSGQFPWQVSLQYKSGSNWFHTCGGTLIKANRVLTAAHCYSSGRQYRVFLGSHLLNSQVQVIDVTSYVRHPNYDGNAAGYPNDVAVLKLASNANTGLSTISTISMAAKGQDFTGQQCTISGWGHTVGGGSIPNVLQHVDMTQISNAACATDWGSNRIFNTHICIDESGKSACNGDSGGPMVCNGVLAGVTSWGATGCPGTYPSVYGRVSEFLDWINAQ